ncbi:MAG: lipoyl(octanoyl) transferase LipB [Anaerolineae bacterium]
MSEGNDKTVWLLNLGVEPYRPVLELQHRIVAAKKDGWRCDVLLLLEHEPVYTLGRHSDESFILADRKALEAQGIEVVRIERGGEVTYHGPGQIVGYPILDLGHFRKDIRWYIGAMGDVIIRTLADYGISGEFDPKYPGVWINGGKICAVGVKNERWVMYHGFAMNIDPDMEHWRGIVPCGLVGKDVATLAGALGWRPSSDEVRHRIATHFAEVYGCRVVPVDLDTLEAALADRTPLSSPIPEQELLSRHCEDRVSATKQSLSG